MDDTKFAHDWIADRADRKKYGKTRLKMELQRKGIDKETVGEALDKIDDEDELNPLRDIDEASADSVFLRDELKTGTVEVGLLERRGPRDGRFRLLNDAETAELVREYR